MRILDFVAGGEGLVFVIGHGEVAGFGVVDYVEAGGGDEEG